MTEMKKVGYDAKTFAVKLREMVASILPVL